MPAKKVLRFTYNMYRKVKNRFKLLFYRRLNGQDLLVGLKQLGVKKGDIIYVHSSLSSFGYIIGGVNTLIEALLESVGEDGTIVVPCFSIKGSMANTLSDNYVFVPKKTPSTIGALPEAFRLLKNAVRSIHPTHSVCAIGKKAEYLTAGHQFCETTFGRDTPFHKLLNANCLILLLGVDVQFPTFYHTFEDLNDSFPINVYLKTEFEAKVLDYYGNELIMNIKAHNPEIAKYRIDHVRGLIIRKLFRKYYFKEGGLTEVKIGKAKCYSIRCQDMYKVIELLFKKKITIYNIKLKNGNYHI